MFYIITFPGLKRRNIVLWRLAIWFILTFWELPKHIAKWLVNYPLVVVYNVGEMIIQTFVDIVDTTRKLLKTFVNYAKVCGYLVHAEYGEEKRHVE